jgi:hypothetical protein
VSAGGGGPIPRGPVVRREAGARDGRGRAAGVMAPGLEDDVSVLAP